MVQELMRLVSKIPLEIGTMVRIVRTSMNIEMLMSEVGSRHYYTSSVTKLTICFTVRTGKG